MALNAEFSEVDKFVAEFENVVKNPIKERSSVYYTGVDPRTMKPVFVEHDPHRKISLS